MRKPPRGLSGEEAALWARLAIAWLVFVPGSYITVKYFDGGDVGAMLWLIGYLAVLAAVLWWRFQGGAWRHIQLVDHAEPVADLAA